MGKVFSGVPKKFARILRDAHELSDFIETGTLVGKTAIWAAGHFKRVYTVELDKQLWATMMLKVQKDPSIPKNIEFYYGDSPEFLEGILQRAGKSLIWLDAHWSRDLGYDRPVAGECPLLREIEVITGFSERDDVVLIDDARYFVHSPPRPHKADDWPDVAQIRSAFGAEWKVEVMQTIDVLLAKRTMVDE